MAPSPPTHNAREGPQGHQEGGHGDGEREASEQKHLDELKRNYARLYPPQSSEDAFGEQGSAERAISGTRENGDIGVERTEDAARAEKKKLMKSQGFVNYTEGDFFERSVPSSF